MTKFNLYFSATPTRPIAVGDVVETFRGEMVTVTGWPNTGRNRVYVKDARGNEVEYFPGVIRAELRRED